MIGMFMRNAEGDVAFTCPSDTPKISSFHYVSDARIMTAQTKVGREETFTSEIAPELHAALIDVSRILVAEVDATGNEISEYWAYLSTSATRCSD